MTAEFSGKCKWIIGISRGEKGAVALILVVWVTVILVAIVGEFSYSMRTEVNITRNFKEEEEAYQLALAGIEQAKAEILSVKTNEIVYLNEDDVLVFGADEEDDEDKEKLERNDKLGNGSFKYTITDEDGKLNINTVSLDQLKAFFDVSGVDIDDVDDVDDIDDVDDVDVIVNSIMDWRDTNDLHRLNGAEEDYYQSLEEPYSCKDGLFDFIEELLLVKGMTEKILYGSSKSQKGEEDEDEDNEEVEEDEEDVYDGIEQYLTVYDTGNININTASIVVLEAVFGTDMANTIVTQRETEPISIPIANGKVSSAFFTVISTGTNADGKIKRSVKTVMQKQDNKLEILYWNDNIIG
jgi:general secretion pathway protein K